MERARLQPWLAAVWGGGRTQDRWQACQAQLLQQPAHGGGEEEK